MPAHGDRVPQDDVRGHHIRRHHDVDDSHAHADGPHPDGDVRDHRPGHAAGLRNDLGPDPLIA
ncbi:hypothetical protein ACFV4G_14035 [Kitasatospora sp. NPDC059747]|uniref:hypothetical protein n=1 Tax=Kitasatospora sp. NPDC059747 TaxID=3346930 RepID=UPI0036649B4D